MLRKGVKPLWTGDWERILLPQERPKKQNRPENKMLPNTFEAWIFIIVTCSTSFLIGRWLKKRRNKAKTNDEYVEGLKRRILAENLAQAKNGKKKKQKNR
jgi:hypothetical protein